MMSEENKVTSKKALGYRKEIRAMEDSLNDQNKVCADCRKKLP
jgi:hypothetical protein